MSGGPVFLHHPSSLEHDTGHHPEHPARITAIRRELERRGGLGYAVLESAPAQIGDLELVHPPEHRRAIEWAAARGGVRLDPDTILSEGSYRAALHAAGGAVELVNRLLDGVSGTGFSAHRPPGHHAPPERAMGFCLFNNVAIAARHAVRVRGLDRVLILDWDVHHGNGTAEVFASDPSVLFVSVHQSPLYPGTGQASERGVGPGAGYTVNLPVPARSGDSVWVSMIRHVAGPLTRAFKPELILISAGYDAHREDPLADCLVTDAGFAAMAAAVAELGRELGAPVGAILEGGYALEALGRGAALTMEALAGGAGGPVAGPVPMGEMPVHPLAEAARARLGL